MKNYYLMLLLLLGANIVGAQSFRGLDKSPMDRAYFPDNFAHDRNGDDQAIIKVTYSRPQKKDRQVFGKMVKYDKVWRTGANEATEVVIYKDIRINGKTLKEGTYSLFTIPRESGSWDVIFNSDIDYWGAYKYNEKNDVLRTEAKVKNIDNVVEAFTIQFEEKGKNKGIMMFAFDQIVAEVEFTY